MPASAVTSDAEVCNLALGLVGQRQFINDLDEDTTEALVAKQFYAPLRTQLLKGFEWSFTRAEVALAQTLEEREGWAYCYAEPSDLLKLRYLWAGARPPVTKALRHPHERMLADDRGSFLVCTDLDGAVAVYSANVTTPALWTPEFVDAFAWGLAVRLAAGLAVKPQLAAMMAQGFRQAWLEARAADASAHEADVEPEAEHIRAR